VVEYSVLLLLFIVSIKCCVTFCLLKLSKHLLIRLVQEDRYKVSDACISER
jgi:hypothetical protein